MNNTDNYVADISIFTSRIALTLPQGWQLLDYPQINLANEILPEEIAATFVIAQQKQQRIYIPQVQKTSIWSPTIIAQSGFYPHHKDHCDLLLYYTQPPLPNIVINGEKTFVHDTMQLSFITSSYKIENTNFSTQSMLLTIDAISDYQHNITQIISMTGTWLSNTPEVGAEISQVFDTLTIHEPAN